MITLLDKFSGAGGVTQGLARIPGVEPVLAINHDRVAIASHAANFPGVEHLRDDIVSFDVTKLPSVVYYHASPACPEWTDAKGRKRTFDRESQAVLFGEDKVPDAVKRSRALMEEVPRYLRAMNLRGRPVLIGSVENVIQCRRWDQWQRWLDEIRAEGYTTRVIALNSMHAVPRWSPLPPQSRDRLYVAFWHASIGRDPDWNKWLRPKALCPSCDQVVDAVQAFKRRGNDMGRYRQQYLFLCPQVGCRGQAVEPYALPALTAIDLTRRGRRMGDWAQYRTKPHADATRARVAAGIRKYLRPITYAAAGHTFERTPGVRTWPLDRQLVTQTTTNTLGLAVPPMPVRVGRENHAVAFLPFIAPLRGGGGRERAYGADQPLHTFSAGGRHHLLAMDPAFTAVMRNFTARGDQGQMTTPLTEALRTLTAHGKQSLISWAHLLVPYYGNTDAAVPVTRPIGTLTTKDRYALATADLADVGLDVDNVEIRMLDKTEIGKGMGFTDDYIVLGTNEQIVSQYGRAVTPNAIERIGCALIECLTGEPIEPGTL